MGFEPYTPQSETDILGDRGLSSALLQSPNFTLHRTATAVDAGDITDRALGMDTAGYNRVSIRVSPGATSDVTAEILFWSETDSKFISANPKLISSSLGAGESFEFDARTHGRLVYVAITGTIGGGENVRVLLAGSTHKLGTRPIRPILRLEDADFSNDNDNRYYWNQRIGELRGPFGANEMAWGYVNGEKFVSLYEAAVETTGHTENFDYWTQISGAIIGWEERQPAGAADKDWRTAASNSTGQYLLAGDASPGRLWTSDDYGVTWTERRPAGDIDTFWFRGSVSSTGQYMIAPRASGAAGRLYTSDDYGATWTERQPEGDVNKNWQMSAISATGQYMVAGQDTGRLWTSDDYGVTWTERRPAGDADFRWLSGASDSTGQYLIVGAYGARLWTSDDYGATWDERQPAGAADKNWLTVSSDSTGQYLVAGIDGGRLYTSDDYGATWDERQPAGAADKNWQSSASNSDGLHLLAGNTVRLYSSGDRGVTWNEVRPVGDANHWWRVLASDATGKFQIAGDTLRLYTKTPIAAPDTNKYATKITFAAAAGDGIKKALGSATDDTNQTFPIWVYTEFGIKGFRLGFLRKDGTTSFSGDLTATTTPQRFDVTVDILNGGTTPEVRLLNDSGGTAGELFVWGGACYKDKSIPWAYRTNETGADQAQDGDLLSWPTAIVPDAIYSGGWGMKIIPGWAHDESNTNNYLVGLAVSDYVRYRAAVDKILVNDNEVGAVVGSKELTLPRNALLTALFSAGAGTAGVFGADAGNGFVLGTAWAWAINDFKYGSAAGGTQHLNGLASEPHEEQYQQ